MRLECLKLSLKVIEQTKEYIEPFDRAEAFFKFVDKKKPGRKKKKK